MRAMYSNVQDATTGNKRITIVDLPTTPDCISRNVCNKMRRDDRDTFFAVPAFMNGIHRSLRSFEVFVVVILKMRAMYSNVQDEPPVRNE